MNIYLVSRTDTVDYDEHYAAVIAAKTEGEAQKMFCALKNYHPDKTHVSKIGVTGDGLIDRDFWCNDNIILVSFNAG